MTLRRPKGAGGGYSNARCRKCGSGRVMWMQDDVTGRWSLMAAEFTGVMRVKGNPDVPHDCANPEAGGFTACPHCGKPHAAPSVPGAVICDQFPRPR